MKFIPIHRFETKDDVLDVIIKGPMAPMLSAEAVTKSEDFKNIPMTGLYELKVEDKELFTTMLHADENVRTIPIYCIELTFKKYVVIADLGTDTLPILMKLHEKDAIVAPAYEKFPWIKIPSVESIVEALSAIDSESNKTAYFKQTESICNQWFETKGCGKIMIDRKEKSIDVTRWWYHLNLKQKKDVIKRFSK